MREQKTQENDVDISLGRYEFFVQKTYTVLHTLNDFLLGLWFFIGSFFFFTEPLKSIGIWLFIIGSFQLMVRPAIRLIHDFHLQKHTKK